MVFPSLSGVHARCATASIGALTSSGNPADSFSLPFSCRSAVPFLRLIPVFLLDDPNLALATLFLLCAFPLFFSFYCQRKKKMENIFWIFSQKLGGKICYIEIQIIEFKKRRRTFLEYDFKYYAIDFKSHNLSVK